MVLIDSEDWARVHDLACDIANASTVDDDVIVESLTVRLFELLRALETKYGRCSRLVATEADYTSDHVRRMELYRDALRRAVVEGDVENQRLVAESIADELNGG